VKIGDMVRVTDDPTKICGLGFIISLIGGRHVDVFWLDDGRACTIWKVNLEFLRDGKWISYLADQNGRRRG